MWRQFDAFFQPADAAAGDGLVTDQAALRLCGRTRRVEDRRVVPHAHRRPDRRDRLDGDIGRRGLKLALAEESRPPGPANHCDRPQAGSFREIERDASVRAG
jgi:hypothetical protein